MAALAVLVLVLVIVAGLHWSEHRLSDRQKAFQTGFRMTFGIYPEARP